MLYDSKWERRFEKPPPPDRHGWFLFFLSVLVPVSIVAYAIADTFNDVMLLIWPVLANMAAIGVSWFVGR